jgi:hypothetical protein
VVYFSDRKKNYKKERKKIINLFSPAAVSELFILLKKKGKRKNRDKIIYKTNMVLLV